MIRIELLNDAGAVIYSLPMLSGGDSVVELPLQFSPGSNFHAIRLYSDELPAPRDCQRCAELEARLDAIKSAGRWDADEDLT